MRPGFFLFFPILPFFFYLSTTVSHPRDSRADTEHRRTLQRQSGQLTLKKRSRRGIADRSQPPSWPGGTGEHHEDPPSCQPAPPDHFCCTAKVRALSAGNTIEGGLMEIKTPYRIPYVSQMAALDGVGYKNQPSLQLFTCFLPGGPSQFIEEEERCFFTTGDCPLKIH